MYVIQLVEILCKGSDKMGDDPSNQLRTYVNCMVRVNGKSSIWASC